VFKVAKAIVPDTIACDQRAKGSAPHREFVMDRRSVLLGSAGICTTLVAVAVSSEIAEAQDAKQSVQKAIDSFGAALSSLDLNKMMDLWSQAPDIVLLNPRDKEPAIGIDAVKKGWEKAMGSWESLKVSSNGASTIHVSGNTAYRFTPEGVVGKNKEGKELSFVALATTTYVKRGKDWLITSHHASAMPT
jgi:ketosteroid isomerase-like protein